MAWQSSSGRRRYPASASRRRFEKASFVRLTDGFDEAVENVIKLQVGGQRPPFRQAVSHVRLTDCGEKRHPVLSPTLDVVHVAHLAVGRATARIFSARRAEVYADGISKYSSITPAGASACSSSFSASSEEIVWIPSPGTQPSPLN